MALGAGATAYIVKSRLGTDLLAGIPAALVDMLFVPPHSSLRTCVVGIGPVEKSPWHQLRVNES
jgi:hypothetical protein